MKLIDSLYELKKDTNKYVIHNRFDFGFRYKETDNEFLICNKNTGYYRGTGLTNILTSHLFDDGWKIKDVVNIKYKIGDRFLMPPFSAVVTDEDTQYLHEYLNAVVVITDCICVNGHVKYNLYCNEANVSFLLEEEELKQYDMVNNQEQMNL